ncbi:MAG: PAS domain-containing protein [Vicinamibacterales bacterium]
MLLRMGLPRASFLTQACGAWIYITATAYLFGGVSGVSVYIYPLLILLLGWLSSARAAAALAAVTSITTLAFALADMRGLLPAPPPTTPLLRWVVETCVFALAAIIVSQLRSSYVNRLRDVQQLGAHLADRNTEVLAREAQLEAILASTTEGILAVGSDGRVIRANRRFAELWRIPESLLATGDDRALLDYVLAQLVDRDGFLALVQALYGSEDESIDFVAFKDGRVFERSTAPLRLDGRHTGRIWSFRDISDRRRAEERLQLAMEVAKVVPFEVDLPDDRLLFDSAGLVTLGLPDTDDLRTFSGWLCAVHPDDRRRFKESVQSGFQPGDPAMDCEYRMPGVTGEWEWIHTRARVIQRATDDGAPIRAVGSSMNVSVRKRLELAHLQAQKLVSIGTLAGGIAHDFNNILAAVRGNVDEAALATPGDHPAAGHLRDIRRSTERAADLVRRIMTFARQGEARREPVDLRPVTLEVLKLLRSTLPATIELRTRFGGEAPDVLADATQVHEVLDEPDDQRGACDWTTPWHHHVHARLRRRRRADGGDHSRYSPRTLQPARGCRRRVRDGGGDTGTHLRRVLHDEARGRGNRTRPLDGSRDHAQSQRRGDRRQHAGLRVDVHALLPDFPNQGTQRRVGAGTSDQPSRLARDVRGRRSGAGDTG